VNGPTGSGAELALDSDPTTHFAFVLQVRLTEFRGEIAFFAKNDAVMKDHSERDDKEQRDPVVKKKAERNLQQTKSEIHRVTGETKRPVAHKR
jgi:hypothetical protein